MRLVAIKIVVLPTCDFLTSHEVLELPFKGVICLKIRYIVPMEKNLNRRFQPYQIHKKSPEVALRIIYTWIVFRF